MVLQEGVVKGDDGQRSVASFFDLGGERTPQTPYSSSSPKKKRCAQRSLQKVRPYSRRPQSMHTNLKQIGHF